MMNFRFPFLLLLALGSVTVARRAHAQVSDADRRAARDLYFEGDAFQKGGRYADALDRFERSLRVVHAPTTLLHIAECQVSLKKLVEASETYRELSRYPLKPPPGATEVPSSWVAAKQQGATEEQQLQPLLPELRINVSPIVSGVYVTIDDAPLNEALIGVSRSINPGIHRVAAVAQNYIRAEQSVDIRERAREQVTLELRPSGVAPAIPPPPTQAVPAQPEPPQQPPSTQNPQAAPDANNPAFIPPPPKKTSTSSALLGIRLGGGAPLDSKNPYSGAVFGFEAGVRVATYMTLSGVLDFASMKRSSSADTSTTIADDKLTVVSAAAYVGLITNPEGVFGVWTQLGVVTRAETLAGTTKSGSGVALSVGIPLKFGMFRLAPRIDIDFANSAGFFGFSGIYEIDLDKSKR